MDNDQVPSIRLVQVCVEYFVDDRVGITYSCFFYIVLYLFPVSTMLVTYGKVGVYLWQGGYYILAGMCYLMVRLVLIYVKVGVSLWEGECYLWQGLF